jgi:gamma-glutamyltranspeptidase
MEQIPDRSSVYYGVKDLAKYLHINVENMKRVYADRSEYLGDPDFWKVPTAMLTDKK